MLWDIKVAYLTHSAMLPFVCNSDDWSSTGKASKGSYKGVSIIVVWSDSDSFPFTVSDATVLKVLNQSSNLNLGEPDQSLVQSSKIV